MEWFADLLKHYPELAIFLTLAFGFWIGKFKIGKLNPLWLIVSSATPSTAEIVCEPASNPAASPALYPISLASKKGTNRENKHISTAKNICGSPSFFSPRKNCGPTLYPTAKRNRRKNTDLMGAPISICNCPINTPTSNTLVTVPKENLPILNLPIQKPKASVRKMVRRRSLRCWE